MSFNYKVGVLLEKLGYKVVKTHEYPSSTLNFLDLGYEIISRLDLEGWIVQIGAFDGSLVDPLERIINRTVNKVLLVEPQSQPFDTLSSRYGKLDNFHLENSVIGMDGTVNLHVPDLSAADPRASVLPSHHKRFGIKSNRVRSIVKTSLSVSSLLKKHEISSVSVLQIDTEGFDYEIIKQFFAEEIFPLVINCETNHLNSTDRRKLRQDLSRYEYLTAEGEQDTFAIRWDQYLDCVSRRGTC